MERLYYNPDTKIIFASEDEQPVGIVVIDSGGVPGLIANGATVDPSADSLLAPVDAGNGASAAAAPGVSATGLVTADEGNAAGGVSAAQSPASTSAADATGSAVVAEPDHKSILQTMLDDLEGIVHMGKSEIIAVIDRAKALL
jgi:hypothetical protein